MTILKAAGEQDNRDRLVDTRQFLERLDRSQPRLLVVRIFERPGGHRYSCTEYRPYPGL